MNDIESRIKAEPDAATIDRMKHNTKPLFETGQVFIERRVLVKFPLAVIDELLVDYVECVSDPCSDWERVNEIALRDGGPIFTLFRDDAGNEAYIVTDPDRSKTTIMMKNESA